jgi:3-hydroxyisobutyrate dehydrogenase-like beta-hydroxyacid dehydrogenase
MVGGPREAAARCRPVFDSFSRHVAYLGGAGAGQTAKLLNNALLMLNQASIAEILDLAAGLELEPARLVEVLRLGSANSDALGHFGSFITTENVGHLSSVEALDMELFATAMRDAGVDAGAITARGLAGANGGRGDATAAAMTVTPSSAADTEAVTQLVLRERQSRDRGRWQEMAECFAAGS